MGVDSQTVKRILTDLGADLCGVADVGRFSEAPEGFHPRDVLPICRSVVAFAKRFPAGTLQSASTIPYTIVRNLLSEKLDMMAVDFCDAMERRGVVALPTGTIGPTEFDRKTGRSRNIISAKHAAVAAGLGVLGKNSLLITPEYGNMVWLSAVVTDAALTPDPLCTETLCPESCRDCIDACPASALSADTMEMKQTVCWGYAFGAPEGGGEWRIKCFRCRAACPHCLGSRNGAVAKG